MIVTRILILGLCVVSAASILAATDETDEPIEILNPGFEDGREGWSFARNMVIDESVAHSGRKSARVTVSDPIRETVYLTRQIPIQGGALYRADCFIRIEDVREAKGRFSSVGAGLIVEWCDRGGKWMQGGTYACNLFGTDDWRQVKCMGLRAPDDAGYALVFLTLRGTGRAWFDDFRLVKVNGSISKSYPQDGATVNNNCPTFIWKQNPGVRRHWVELSQNPGFEDGTVRRYAAGGMTEFQITEPLDRGVWYWRVVAKGIEDRRPWRFTQTASKDRDCLAPIPLERARRVTCGDEPFTVKIRASAAERPDVSIGNWRGVPGAEENGTIAFRFDPPADGWPEGLQEMRIKTCDCAGNRKELPFWFLNKPRPESPAQIDKHGRFAENGRPIFPLGIYEVAPKYMQEVRHTGFDVVHSYRWEYTQDDESCRKYLDACWAANGLRAFIGFDRGVNSGKGIVQGELAPIARRVGALADHPGLFCWYLFDEPELFGQFVTPDKLTEMADLVRALDPYHAVVMTTWNKTMSEYRRTWDTHWTQAYGSPAQVVEEIDKHRLFLKNDSPITLLVNCNDAEQSIARRKGVPPDPTRFSRDYDHLRACAFLGIVRECNGVWWWWFARDSKDYYSAAQCPQAWSNLVSVVREIGDLRPIVTAEGKATTGCVKTENGNVEWWRKSVGEESVLIAVNTGTGAVSCRLEPRVGDFGSYSFRPHEVKVLRNAEGPLRATQFRIRDPFILADGNRYYLYEAKNLNGGLGVNVFESKDLVSWQLKEPVMTLSPSLKVTAVRAPEVHRYRGHYWLFVTLAFDEDGTNKPMHGVGRARNSARRGVWIFDSDSPTGPFKPVCTGPVTPEGWMAHDGTLYVEDNKPYMVFCHEWTQVGDGRMMVMPLKDDLSATDGEPVELFRASAVKGAIVTDGPFLYRSPQSGKLFMTWSTCEERYSVRMLVSKTGKIAGPWEQCPKDLFGIDGGHGMMFKANDGRLLFALHAPNSGGRTERLRLFEMTDDGDMIRVEGEAPETSRTVLDEWPISCDAVSSVPGEEPSYLPRGRKFKLVWNDEFNADKLDMSKWSYRTNFWGKRFLAYADHGAVVKDGKVHLPIMFENGQYCSPHLQTGEVVWDLPQKPCGWGFWPFPKRSPHKFAHKYGYYECRCRLQQKGGWWSAFWLQATAIGATLDPRHSGVECDIMESFYPGQVLPSCMHYNGYAYDYKGFKSDLSDGDAGLRGGRGLELDKTKYHTFGCLWEPDGYTFYVDGRLKDVKTGTGPGEAVSDVEQFVLISTECKWYRNNHATGEGVPELKEAYEAGDEFIVDYVRVYDFVH